MDHFALGRHCLHPNFMSNPFFFIPVMGHLCDDTVLTVVFSHFSGHFLPLQTMLNFKVYSAADFQLQDLKLCTVKFFFYSLVKIKLAHKWSKIGSLVQSFGGRQW